VGQGHVESGLSFQVCHLGIGKPCIQVNPGPVDVVADDGQEDLKVDWVHDPCLGAAPSGPLRPAGGRGEAVRTWVPSQLGLAVGPFLLTHGFGLSEVAWSLVPDRLCHRIETMVPLG
jgi:hypothetical protein